MAWPIVAVPVAVSVLADVVSIANDTHEIVERIDSNTGGGGGGSSVYEQVIQALSNTGLQRWGNWYWGEDGVGGWSEEWATLMADLAQAFTSWPLNSTGLWERLGGINQQLADVLALHGESAETLAPAETFPNLTGTAVLNLAAGARGALIDFSSVPPGAAAYGTADPVRYRWLGEIAPGWGTRLYRTHYLDYAFNVISDWPQNVDRLRYQFALGATATVTILRPAT